MRWKRIRSQTNQFWRKWQNEYLQHLRCVSKWTKKHPNLKTGQIVLIGDDNNPVAKWPMGIVISTQAGPDGIVRVATVRVGSNLYKRNVRLLAPLPIEMSSIEDVLEPVNEPNRTEHEEDAPSSVESVKIWADRLRPKGGRKWCDQS